MSEDRYGLVEITTEEYENLILAREHLNHILNEIFEHGVKLSSYDNSLQLHLAEAEEYIKVMCPKRVKETEDLLMAKKGEK